MHRHSYYCKLKHCIKQDASSVFKSRRPVYRQVSICLFNFWINCLYIFTIYLVYAVSCYTHKLKMLSKAQSPTNTVLRGLKANFIISWYLLPAPALRQGDRGGHPGAQCLGGCPQNFFLIFTRRTRATKYIYIYIANEYPNRHTLSSFHYRWDIKPTSYWILKP